MRNRSGFSRLRPEASAGFTLIELLVSIILMVILLSAVTLIFVRTTETVAVSQARVTVYTNARYALDVMENDLLGCLPFSNGTQRMILENGRTNPPPGGAKVNAVDTAPSTGFHYMSGTGAAGDLLLFRATTHVGNTVQTCEVCYHLIPGNKAMPVPNTGASNVLPTLATCGQDLQAGDPDRGGTLRPPYRPIYTLVRRVRVPDPATMASAVAPSYNTYPLDAPGPNNPTAKLIPDMELCYFVLSFNIEYLGADMSFSQIDTAPGIGNSPAPPTDPLGDGGGANDGTAPPSPGAPAITSLRITFLRITLVICEDAAARQERQIQKTISIPMG